MTRFSMLVGIGLMLVSALAYALPETQDPAALLAAVAGIIIATGGMVASTDGKAQRKMLQVNAGAALLVVPFILVHLKSDITHIHTRAIATVADIDVLGLTIVFLTYGVREWITSRRNSKSR